MGKSKNRELYFSRIKYGEMTAKGSVEALKASPHKTHRRVSIFLEQQLQSLSSEVIDKLKTQKESDDFAAKVMS